MRLEILGGRLLDPSQSLDQVADLFIENGKIAAIGARPSAFVADQSIDAQGHLVIAGLIDLCASFRSASKARLRTEAKAAVKGGITSLCCPPDASPINDSGAVTSLILDSARDAGLVRVFPIGALTQGLKGEQLSEMNGLKEAGCRMVSNMRRPFKNHRVLRRCLEYARSQSITVFFCPEDHSLAADGCVHEGFISTRLGLNGIPEVAETIAVTEFLLMAEDTGVRAHLSQLSTARSVELVAQAQRRGLPVTADVAVHHLLLTDAMVDGFDSRYHVRPPLRSEHDRDGLRQGVRDGVIQAVCSQHQPLEQASKQAPFAETEPGIIGLESLLPLILRLVDERVLSLPRAVELLTAGPAEVLGVDLGSLRQGVAADIAVVDLAQEWEMSEAVLASACKNTPFLNERMKGLVRYTLVNGQVVFAAA